MYEEETNEEDFKMDDDMEDLESIDDIAEFEDYEEEDPDKDYN